MRKRLPESAKLFIERIRNEPIEQLSREVNFVVTGSTEAFGGERAILIRELQASSPHVRIFVALCLLHGLNQKEVFEVYNSLPPERQVALDVMVKRLIAEEIEDQKLAKSR